MYYKIVFGSWSAFDVISNNTSKSNELSPLCQFSNPFNQSIVTMSSYL